MAAVALPRYVADSRGLLEECRIDLWRIRQDGVDKAFRNSHGNTNSKCLREDARSEERL